MQQTNDELDRDDLSKYSLDKSSDQEQFKKFKSISTTTTYSFHINGTKLVFERIRCQNA